VLRGQDCVAGILFFTCLLPHLTHLHGKTT